MQEEGITREGHVATEIEKEKQQGLGFHHRKSFGQAPRGPFSRLLALAETPSSEI